jgi:peptidoglycan hydrolase-like protein with peptidoglycan-binding domain
MKRLSLLIALLPGFLYSYADTCTDISINLSRGNENNQVFILQEFLVEKGLLKATPNGYFGPQTFAAVKLYQKSKGIIQTGNVATLTRQSVKLETCTVKSPANNYPGGTSQISPVTASTTVQNVTPPLKGPSPIIASIDYATFISGGKMDAPLTIRGTGFSSLNNRVLLKLVGANRVYDLGNFPSLNGTTTVVTPSFVINSYSCGSGCTEPLPVGNYLVTVKTDVGESNEGGITVRSVTTSSRSGTISAPIQQQATEALLGTITIGANTPVSLEEISMSITSSLSSGAGISGLKLVDELTEQVINGGPTFNLNKVLLTENQSKIYSLYGNVNVSSSQSITISSTLKVKEFIGNNFIYITIPVILDTISG